MERERYLHAARAIPQQFSPLPLDRELALHSGSCENVVGRRRGSRAGRADRTGLARRQVDVRGDKKTREALALS